jgi:hypothetical protein
MLIGDCAAELLVTAGFFVTRLALGRLGGVATGDRLRFAALGTY